MSARARLGIVLTAVSLAAGTAFALSEVVPQSGDEAAGERGRIEYLPSGFGAKYDRAVARMTRINHLLEARQADLSYARQGGAPPGVIADLRRQVASLERGYADAIDAMSEATPCEACPEAAGR